MSLLLLFRRGGTSAGSVIPPAVESFATGGFPILDRRWLRRQARREKELEDLALEQSELSARIAAEVVASDDARNRETERSIERRALKRAIAKWQAARREYDEDEITEILLLM